jgi:DNA polymerase I-like protein with 3'-5' exonuclease and polymerase domains
MLRRHGITNAQIWSDTHNLGHLIFEGRRNGLKSLAYHYTRYGGYDEALDSILSKMGSKNYLDIPEDVLAQYATMDAIIAYQINEAMQAQLDVIDAAHPNPHYPEWTLRRYYEEIVIPWVAESAEIELNGIYIDMASLKTSSNTLLAKIVDIGNLITSALLTDIDTVTSQEKLGKLLASRGWPDLGRTKKGGYLTNDEKLEEWARRGYKVASLIQQYRTLTTLYSTFLGDDPASPIEATEIKDLKNIKKGIKKKKDGWYKYIYNKKINPQYKAMLADSHRNKCNSPNFQNIPTHSEHSHLITRNIATPGDNYKFLTFDYAALQIRLCAIESEDPVLADIYRNNRSGGDLHSITGHGIFCAGKEYDITTVDVVTDVGKTKTYYWFNEVKIIRGGVEMSVPAEELKEGDDILEL